MYPHMLDQVAQVARTAGAAILSYCSAANFQDAIQAETKTDDSPVTRADHAAHLSIETGLKTFSDWPILSEEGLHTPYTERQQWTSFWLVDPLDGTKDFMGQGDDFTVNIALVRDCRPVLGAIYQPKKDTLWLGNLDAQFGSVGAWRQQGAGAREAIHTRKALRGSVVAAASKSHGTAFEDAYLRQFGLSELVRVGASLKFCWLAEGKADVYCRLVSIAEWDIAAGEAILVAAGGSLLTSDGEMVYNTQDIRTEPFVAVGDSILLEGVAMPM